MVRSALGTSGRIGKGPPAYAPYVPAISVAAASLLNALPIISQTGWYPDFGFLMLISWRLLRADAFPAWWAAPLGLVNDLFTGLPIGFSIALWSLAMLLLELADRRTMWRDYWIEWLLAAALVAFHQAFSWKVAAWAGADLPPLQFAPALAISVLIFPLTALLALRLDRWRLGRG